MPTYIEEDIGPEEAEVFLKLNKLNRNIRPRKVDEYAEMMHQGQWITDNGEPMVVIDRNNELANGQHRMLAIIKAGITLHGCLVVRGASPMSRPTIDENIKRQFSDDLTMAGLRNSHANASLFRKILVWDYNGGLAGIDKTSFPRPVMNKAWPASADSVIKTVQACQRWHARWPGNKGALHFMYWLLTQRNHNNVEAVDRFFSILTDGSQDPDDKLLISVREAMAGRISKYRTERNQVGLAYQVFFMHRAWNGWLRGDKVTRLALPKGGLTDPFPKLLVAR